MTKYFAVAKNLIMIDVQFCHLVLISKLLMMANNKFFPSRKCAITIGFYILKTIFPFGKEPVSFSVS